MENIALPFGTQPAAVEPIGVAGALPRLFQSDLSRGEAVLEIDGALPHWLEGRLIRTAPAVFRVGGWRAEHWFDGLGMLYAFEMSAAGVRYSQRALDTEFAAQARTGRVRTSSFASPNQRSFLRRVFEPVPGLTDNANVNVLRLGSEWVALTESAHQLSIDEASLAVRGRIRYEDGLPTNMPMLAHPHFDFDRQRVVNLGMRLGRFAEIIAFSHDAAARQRVEIGRVQLRELPYLHSFGLTRDKLVVVGHPFRTTPLRLLWSNRGFIEHFSWKPEQGTRLIVLDRSESNGKSRSFETEPMFVFHTVNTFQDGPDVVIDVLAYPDARIVDEFRTDALGHELTVARPTLRRIRMRGDGKTTTEELSSIGFEFPSINYRKMNGKAHRYVWGSTYRQDGQDLLKIDCDTGVVSRWGLPKYGFGEPVFVARPGAIDEDDGVVLTVGSTEQRSVLAVLDAHTLESRALVHADLPIPLGFHGSFTRAPERAETQRRSSELGPV